MDVSEIEVSQHLQKISINNESSAQKLPQKNLYEVPTTLGKLTIQVTRFSQYIIIVVTYSESLKIDGYLQIAHPTPYSDKPIVINIQKDQGQMDNQKVTQILSKQLKCPVLLSFNIEELSKGSEEELLEVLRRILHTKKQQSE